MIKKILKIKGIGRFDDYNINSYSSPIWNKEFKPLTLIYASNGSGKTTLATIFSSLKGNDELLLKKKAFNFQGSSEIEIYFGDKKNEYKNDKWNSHCDAIEVFDTHFINDNIYTGEILTEHRKNLFEIVIGAGGIELKKAIINNREQQKLEREKRKRIEDNITQLSSDISTVDKFVGLKLSNDIETTILNLESKIKQIRNKDQIQEFTILKPLLIFDRIIFDKLKTILVHPTF
jgi:wobble nucleotide-excising tRNase